MSWFLEKLLRLRAGELAGADQVLPTFNAEYNNWIILALGVVFIVLVALTVLCYLREGNLPQRVKLGIAAIRIVVILVVFLLLFQPGVVLRYKKNVYSSVLVLLDDSLSMSLKDRYADPALRKALAEALKVDPQRLGEMTRSEIVRELLARQGGPLAQLAREHKLVLMRFAAAEGAYVQRVDELNVPSDDDELARTVMRIQRGLMTRLAARGYQTNLARALRRGAERLQGRRVAAVVLVSDGQDTADWPEGAANPIRAALAELTKRHIPVYAVAVGDPEPRRNVKVTRLQGPKLVRKGSEIELTGYLANRNCGGQTVQVRLYRRPVGEQKWSDTSVGKVVKLAGEPDNRASEEQKVILRHPAGELGEFEYELRVEPLEGEAETDDNHAAARVKVSEEKLKVLLVSGDGGWEFQYLRNLLLRSPKRYAVSVWQQDADKEFNQEASTGMALARLPRTRKELFEYEVVILYDPAYTKDGFDGLFVSMLEELVADHHGGLCYIASNKYSDMNLVGTKVFEPLANMLPVELDRRSIDIAERITRGRPVAWPVMPTAVGMDHPTLRFAPEVSRNLQIWQTLPGIYWSHPVLRLKPLASALAVSSDPQDRLTRSGREPTPIIAVQYYGKGRCLYLGTDETWRWRYLDDGRYYRRFWHNVVDFLAAGRGQKQRVVITTGAERFTVGDKMRIRVEAYDRDYRPLTAEKFIVEMIPRAKGKTERIELRLKAGKKHQGRYEAEIVLKQVGVFELTAKRDDPTYKGLVAGKTITVGLPEEERRRPEANLALLQTIAPGRRFMLIHQADELPHRVPSGKLTLFNDVPKDLWDVPLIVVLVVSLLGAEWILRKKYNMA